MQRGSHDPDLAPVKVFQLKALAARVEAGEKRADVHGAVADELSELLTEVRLELERNSTTIRIWGSLVLFGAPLLATFGAWLVVRNTTPPATPSPAMRTASTPVCDLPEITIATGESWQISR